MIKTYLISGRVQGVGYRYFTLEIAKQLSLVGFVKNLPNGKVKVIVDYTKMQSFNQVEKKLLSYLWKGPVESHVKTVDVSFCKEISPIDFKDKFQIL